MTCLWSLLEGNEWEPGWDPGALTLRRAVFSTTVRTASRKGSRLANSVLACVTHPKNCLLEVFLALQ